jgi:multiple sugar transport system permease protein
LSKPIKFNQKSLIGVGFMLPAIIVVFFLVLYPIWMTIMLSFQKIKFFGIATTTGASFTLKNYVKLFESSDFWHSLMITCLYTLIAVAVAFAIGLFTALMLNQKFVGRRVARVIILLVWPVPAVAVSLMFIWMFDASFRVINYILRSMHLITDNIAWLSTPVAAFAAVTITTIWKSYPFFTLMLLAGLQAIPKELYEAANVDGANRLQQFKNITMPALRSVVTISLVLNGLWVFRNFDIIYVMTEGGPMRSTETLSVQLYQEAFKYFHISYGSAIGVVSLIICLFILVVAIPSLSKEFY